MITGFSKAGVKSRLRIVSAIVFFCSAAGICQQKTEITGIIFDARTSLPVPCSFVELQAGDTIIKQRADSGGRFAISLPEKLLKGNSANLVAWQDKGVLLTQLRKKITCKETINFGGYSNGNLFISFADSLRTTYFYEIPLIPVETEFGFPLVIFKKNSLKIIKTEKALPDTNFICLAEGLEINPGLKLEIRGYGFEENDENKIAIERAEYIKIKLVKLGVDPERLIVKGYGPDQAKWSKEDILLVDDEAKRKQMTILNRRVEFKVIAFDFNRKGNK